MKDEKSLQDIIENDKDGGGLGNIIKS